MSTIAVGDMARQFTSFRNGDLIKSELATLSNSLSSGKVADLTKSLGGELDRFSGIRYSLTQLTGYQQSAKEVSQTLANAQIALGGVEDLRNSASQQLLMINPSSPAAQVDEVAASTKDALASAVRLLNTQVADRSLFGGAEVGIPPLASAEDMLAALNTAAAGLIDAASISAVVEAWFDDPTGGFATVGYLGDTGANVQKRLNDTTTVELPTRADDQGIVDVLKGFAKAALANELSGLQTVDKAALLETAGKSLFVAASGFTAVQARLGSTEQQVEDAVAANTATQTSFSLLQNDLETADPFETASRLQAVQLQLETHFAVTARMSQLSLLRYI